MNEQIQDRVDRYLRDEMTDKERSEFENQLTEDVDLQEAYEFTIQVQEALKSHREKMEMMRQWDKEDHETTEKERMHRIFRNRVIGGLLVAAVLVVGVFLFYPRQVEMPPLEKDGFEVYRSGGNLTQIVDMIQAGKYSEALTQIENKEKEFVQIPLDSLSSLSDEERERAEYEAEVMRQETDHLKWLKVYALMGLDRREEALLLLDELRNRNGVYRHLADSLFSLMK